MKTKQKLKEYLLHKRIEDLESRIKEYSKNYLLIFDTFDLLWDFMNKSFKIEQKIDLNINTMTLTDLLYGDKIKGKIFRGFMFIKNEENIDFVLKKLGGEENDWKRI